jgi:antirestriction protein ArdC
MKSSKNVYEIVNERIFLEMEKGIIPWRKPWVNYDSNGEFIPPQNLVTKKPYQGINFMILLNLFNEPYYLTFKQIRDLGGTLIKDSRSIPITFWKPYQVEETNPEGEKVTKQRFFLRYYNVFNITQTEDIEYKPSIVQVTPKDEFKAIKKAETIVEGFNDTPAVSHNANSAYYSPGSDKVSMPAKESFHTPAGYYATLFHELSHSTGHAKRLSRKGVTDPVNFGSHNYSKEELIAEFSAAYLCSYSGIQHATIENSAAYIQSWLSALKDDSRMLVNASSQGQKSCDYILNGAV